MKYFIIIMLIPFLISCSKEEPKKIEISRTTTPETASEQPVVKDETVTESENKSENRDVEIKDIEEISSNEAGSYVGKTAIVSGFAADVHQTPKVTYINFDKRFPNHTFTGVIFANKLSLFKDVKKLEGRKLKLQGKITTYRGKPQIILNSPDQILEVN